MNLELKKPTFCIMFDTIVWDESYYELQALLKRFRIPVGLAIDPTAVQDGLPIKRYIMDMGQSGNEILVHTPPGEPSFLANCAMDSDEIEERITDYQKGVEALGFSCDGLILAGGTDSCDKVRRAARKHYRYCQSVKNCWEYPKNPAVIPYNTPETDPMRIMRTNMECNNVIPSDVIAAMERAIADNGLMLLYAHNYNTTVNWHTTEEILLPVLAYLREKADNGIIVLDTPIHAISYYF